MTEALWTCLLIDPVRFGVLCPPSAQVAVADSHQGRQIRSQRHGNMDQQTRSDANAGRAQIEKLKCGLSARKNRKGQAEARLYLQRGPASAAQRANT